MAAQLDWKADRHRKVMQASALSASRHPLLHLPRFMSVNT